MFRRRLLITEPTAMAECDWCDLPAVLCVRAHGDENERACVTHAANLVCYLFAARAVERRYRRDTYGQCGNHRHIGRLRDRAAGIRLRCGEFFTALRARRIAATRHPTLDPSIGGDQ